MSIVPLVSKILALLTLFGGIVIVFFLVAIIYKAILKKSLGPLSGLEKFVKNNALLFAFLVALFATSGSLFYSEVAGYGVCKLCWFQRILMYPQVVLLGVALIKRARDIADYVIPLSLIGGAIAGFQYLIQRLTYSIVCPASVSSCSLKYSFQLGYITIPMMALTAFILIIFLTYFWKINKRSLK